MSMRKGIAAYFLSWGWIVAEKAIIVSVGLLSNFLIAKNLGVDDFGRLQSGLSFVFIFGSFFLVLNGQGLTPFFSTYQRSWARFIPVVFWGRIIFSSLCYFFIVIGYYFGFLLKSDVFLGLIVFSESLAVAVIVFYCKNEIFLVSLSRIIGGGIRLIWLYCFLQSFDNYVWLLAWPLEAIVATGIPGFFVFKKYSVFCFGRLLYFRARLFYFVKSCIRFLPSVVLATIVSRLDRLFYSYFLSSEVLGLYSAAAVIVDQWLAVVVLMVSLLQSSVIYTKKFGSLERSALISGCGVFFLCFIVYILSLGVLDRFFILFYGDAFSGAVPIALGGVLSVAFQGFDLALTSVLYVRKSGWLLFLKNLASVVLGVVLFFLFSDSVGLYAFYCSAPLVAVFFWIAYYLRNSNEARFCR